MYIYYSLDLSAMAYPSLLDTMRPDFEHFQVLKEDQDSLCK
jgi:hypothetical protein